MYLVDIERRIFLAKLLRIPPELLGLTVYSVMDDKYAIAGYTEQLKRMTKLAEEDSYYAYEDILVLGWDCLRKGSISLVAERITRRLKKLEGIVQRCPQEEKEAWQTMLFQYHRLAAACHMHTLEEPFRHINAALSLAEELDDSELIATAYMHRAHRSIVLKHVNDAKTDIDKAVTYTESAVIHAPLKGNIYLRAAEINSHLGGGKQIQEENKRWHALAADLAYELSNVQTSDRTFQVLNTSGVHHERAKTLIKLYQFDLKKQHLKDAEHELHLARKTLTPELVEWQLYFSLSEASLRKAQNDIEESATMGKEAHKIACLMASQSGIQQVTDLYVALHKEYPTNLEVISLGAQLGIF